MRVRFFAGFDLDNDLLNATDGVAALYENGATMAADLVTRDTSTPKFASYYVRVLENPTCRWSTWDAIRAGVEARPSLHKTIQERAWSSPIRFVPAS